MTDPSGSHDPRATGAGAPTRALVPGVDDLFDGRYRLGRVLGQGGYSRVYEAVDMALGRTVALKVIAGDGADPADAVRVRSEIRLLASLSHPSLVTLYDARLDGAPAYLVMELIAGQTLSDLIAHGPRSGPETARIGREMAEAFAVIHARGIVHRDVKPSNILLRPAAHPGESPRATLADFGIASLVGATRVTAANSVIGTAAYLSPEQARGMPPAPASDVYSLGLVLLEALTARRPFADATPHEALAARLVTPPPIPAHLPAPWREVIERMTAIAPGERPDATELLAVFRSLSGVSMRAESPPPTGDDAVTRPSVPATGPTRVFEQPERERPTGRSRRRAVVVGAIAAAVLVVGGVGAVAAVNGATSSATPDLPSLPQPLDQHVDDLWNEVGP